MNGTVWAILGILVLFVLWKFAMGQPSEDGLTVMQEAVAEGGLLLDVRSPREFKSGHLDGARNIPVGELSGRLGELGSTDQSIVVYCASGGRSRSAAKLLQDNGFSQVHDLGAMRNWK